MKDKILSIPISSLRPNAWNPNSIEESEIQAMAARFSERKEVDKPLTVRRVGDEYEIIDGEQTYKASLLVPDIKKLPCIVEDIDDIAAIAMTFVKNLHGKMDNLRVCHSLDLIISKGKEQGREYSNGDLAKLFGKTEGAIRSYKTYGEVVSILNNLPSRVGFPTDDEIGKMSWRTIADYRRKLKKLTAGGGVDSDASGGSRKAFEAVRSKVEDMTLQEKMELRDTLNALIAKEEKGLIDA